MYQNSPAEKINIPLQLTLLAVPSLNDLSPIPIESRYWTTTARIKKTKKVAKKKPKTLNNDSIILLE